MFKAIFLPILSFFLLSHCKDNGSSTDSTVSNLTVQFTVSNDQSGTVSFVARATNATAYDFDFGNGVFDQSSSGDITYKYTKSGTYAVNVIAKNGKGSSVAKSVDVTVTVQSGLIWSDEFDYSGSPASDKWGYDIGTGSGGWGNNEVQYYTNRTDNAIVSNGTLKITAKKENYQGSTYTSARLLTKGKFSFKYGRVEARVKVPTGVGTWPAVWMLGDNFSTAGWPACGEIDIMEHLGRDLNKIYGTLHYPGRSGGNANGATKVIQNATTEFHLYGLEWDQNQIKISVDGDVYFTFTNSSSVPFNQNFFLIVNMAIGGNFGGSVDANLTSAVLEVDYIRVYQ